MLENKKLIYTVLIISLAFNTFIIGGVGYYAVKWNQIKNDKNWMASRLDRVEERIVRHLDGEDKTLVERVFRERRAALRGALGEMRTARKSFRAGLLAGDPDPVNITQALDRSQRAMQTINENFHGALRDMTQGLSPEARRKIATHMKRRGHRYEEEDN